MENKQQNREIEEQATKAAKGARFSWSATPISETPAAIASDPFRMLPGPARARRNYGRDIEAVDPRTEAEKYNDTTGANDAEEDWREYLGEPGEDAYGWFSNLATQLDGNSDANRPWFNALQSYIQGLPLGTTCGDLDETMLEKCLKEICTQGEPA